MGDTNIFADLELYGELYDPHVVLAPIGDHYTMGHEEAAYAVEMIGTKLAVPIHYGTWPPLVGDPQQFKNILEDISETKVAIPEIGANFLGWQADFYSHWNSKAQGESSVLFLVDIVLVPNASTVLEAWMPRCTTGPITGWK